MVNTRHPIVIGKASITAFNLTATAVLLSRLC